MHDSLSIRRQCELLGLPRSVYYQEPAKETAANLKLMRIMDEQHLKHPEFGRRMMTDWLSLQGHRVNVKRVRRLMKKMGLEAVYCKPRTTIRNKEHKVYPYLLRDLKITYPNHVKTTGACVKTTGACTASMGCHEFFGKSFDLNLPRLTLDSSDFPKNP